MLILGIDPGATGAAALVASDCLSAPQVIDLDDDPAVTVANLLVLLDCAGKNAIQAVVERAQAMPKQGSVSTARYMTGYGVILGCLVTRRVPYDTVRPSTWKKAMGLGRDKAVALATARRLFPDAELHLKKHHNRAEALLLAEWARRSRFPKDD